MDERHNTPVSKLVNDEPDGQLPADGTTVQQPPAPPDGATVQQSPTPPDGATVQQSPTPPDGATVQQSPAPPDGATVQQSPTPPDGATVQPPAPPDGATVQQPPTPQDDATVQQPPAPQDDATVHQPSQPLGGDTVHQPSSPDGATRGKTDLTDCNNSSDPNSAMTHSAPDGVSKSTVRTVSEEHFMWVPESAVLVHKSLSSTELLNVLYRSNVPGKVVKTTKTLSVPIGEPTSSGEFPKAIKNVDMSTNTTSRTETVVEAVPSIEDISCQTLDNRTGIVPSSETSTRSTHVMETTENSNSGSLLELTNVPTDLPEDSSCSGRGSVLGDSALSEDASSKSHDLSSETVAKTEISDPADRSRSVVTVEQSKTESFDTTDRSKCVGTVEQSDRSSTPSSTDLPSATVVEESLENASTDDTRSKNEFIITGHTSTPEADEAVDDSIESSTIQLTNVPTGATFRERFKQKLQIRSSGTTSPSIRTADDASSPTDKRNLFSIYKQKQCPHCCESVTRVELHHSKHHADLPLIESEYKSRTEEKVKVCIYCSAHLPAKTMRWHYLRKHSEKLRLQTPDPDLAEMKSKRSKELVISATDTLSGSTTEGSPKLRTNSPSNSDTFFDPFPFSSQKEISSQTQDLGTDTVPETSDVSPTVETKDDRERSAVNESINPPSASTFAKATVVKETLIIERASADTVIVAETEISESSYSSCTLSDEETDYNNRSSSISGQVTHVVSDAPTSTKFPLETAVEASSIKDNAGKTVDIGTDAIPEEIISESNTHPSHSTVETLDDMKGSITSDVSKIIPGGSSSVADGVIAEKRTCPHCCAVVVNVTKHHFKHHKDISFNKAKYTEYLEPLDEIVENMDIPSYRRKLCPHCYLSVIRVNFHHSRYHPNFTLIESDYKSCIPYQVLACTYCGTRLPAKSMRVHYLKKHSENSNRDPRNKNSMHSTEGMPCLPLNLLNTVRESMEVLHVKCQFCSGSSMRRYSSYNALSQHLKSVHSFLRRTCPKCCTIFPITVLFGHVLSCKGNSPGVQCRLCGVSPSLSGKTAAEMLAHLRCHGITTSCTICSRVFCNELALKSHLSIHETVSFEIFRNVRTGSVETSSLHEDENEGVTGNATNEKNGGPEHRVETTIIQSETSSVNLSTDLPILSIFPADKTVKKESLTIETTCTDTVPEIELSETCHSNSSLGKESTDSTNRSSTIKLTNISIDDRRPEYSDVISTDGIQRAAAVGSPSVTERKIDKNRPLKKCPHCYAIVINVMSHHFKHHKDISLNEAAYTEYSEPFSLQNIEKMIENLEIPTSKRQTPVGRSYRQCPHCNETLISVRFHHSKYHSNLPLKEADYRHLEVEHQRPTDVSGDAVEHRENEKKLREHEGIADSLPRPDVVKKKKYARKPTKRINCKFCGMKIPLSKKRSHYDTYHCDESSPSSGAEECDYQPPSSIRYDTASSTTDASTRRIHHKTEGSATDASTIRIHHKTASPTNDRSTLPPHEDTAGPATDSSTLRPHYDSDYRCSFCALQFNNGLDLSRHIFSEHYHNFAGFRLSSQKETSLKHHEKKWIMICQFCSTSPQSSTLRFSSYKAMSDHLEKAHSYLYRTCPNCCTVFPVTFLLSHVLACKGNSPGILCSLCGVAPNLSGRSAAEMLVHIRCHDANPRSCTICRTTFRDEHELEAHLTVHETVTFKVTNSDRLGTREVDVSMFSQQLVNIEGKTSGQMVVKYSREILGAPGQRATPLASVKSCVPASPVTDTHPISNLPSVSSSRSIFTEPSSSAQHLASTSSFAASIPPTLPTLTTSHQATPPTNAAALDQARVLIPVIDPSNVSSPRQPLTNYVRPSGSQNSSGVTPILSVVAATDLQPARRPELPNELSLREDRVLLEEAGKVQNAGTGEREGVEESIQCLHCPFTSTNGNALRAHFFQTHAEHNFSTFDAHVSALEKLKERIKGNAPEQVVAPPAVDIECLHCDFTNENANTMKAHFFQVHPGEDFKVFEKFVSLFTRRMEDINQERMVADMKQKKMEDQQKMLNDRLEEQSRLVEQKLQAMDRQMQLLYHSRFPVDAAFHTPESDLVSESMNEASRSDGQECQPSNCPIPVARPTITTPKQTSTQRINVEVALPTCPAFERSGSRSQSFDNLGSSSESLLSDLESPFSCVTTLNNIPEKPRQHFDNTITSLQSSPRLRCRICSATFDAEVEFVRHVQKNHPKDLNQEKMKQTRVKEEIDDSVQHPDEDPINTHEPKDEETSPAVQRESMISSSCVSHPLPCKREMCTTVEEAHSFAHVKLEPVDYIDSSDNDSEAFGDVAYESFVGSSEKSKPVSCSVNDSEIQLRDCYVRLEDIVKHQPRVQTCSPGDSVSARPRGMKRKASESESDPGCTKSHTSLSSGSDSSCKRSFMTGVKKKARIDCGTSETYVPSTSLRALLHIPEIPGLPRAVGKDCPVCEKSFPSSALANMHVFSKHCQQILNKSPTLPCPVCDKAFSGPLSLYGHILYTHRVSKKIASDAERHWSQVLEKTGVKIDLSNLHDEDSNVPEMTCPICGVRLSTKFGLLTHIVRWHSEKLLGEQVKFKCSICSMSFTFSNSASRHIRDVHMFDGKAVQALHAAITTVTTIVGPMAFAEHHDAQATRSEKSVPEAEIHGERAGGEPGSPVCGRKRKASIGKSDFSEVSDSSCERSCTNKVKKNAPNDCGTSETRVPSTLLRALLHIPEIPNLPRALDKDCPVCEQSFPSSALANMHVFSKHCQQILNKSPSLSCPECSEVCEGPLYLYGHILYSHSLSVRNLALEAKRQWEQVLKEFGAIGNMSNLDDEEKNVPKGTCPMCGERICNRRSLLAHIIRFHSEQLTGEQFKFSCSICGRLFTYASVASKHIREHIGADDSEKMNALEKLSAAQATVMTIVGPMAYTDQSRKALAPRSEAKHSNKALAPRSEAKHSSKPLAPRSEAKHSSKPLAPRSEAELSHRDHKARLDLAKTVPEAGSNGQPETLSSPNLKHWKPTECPICRKSYHCPALVKDHIVSRHSEELTGKQYLIKCSVCSKTAAGFSNLYTHIRHIHNDNDRAKKELAEVRESEPYLGVLEIALTRSGMKESGDSDSNGCGVCGKKLFSPQSARDHIVAMHSEELTKKQHFFRCSICKNKYRKFLTAYVHIRNLHHGNKKALNELLKVRTSEAYLQVLDAARNHRPPLKREGHDVKVAEAGRSGMEEKYVRNPVEEDLRIKREKSPEAADDGETEAKEEVRTVAKKLPTSPGAHPRSFHECNLCKKRFSTFVFLNDHIVAMHSEELIGEQFLFQCSVCKQGFRKYFGTYTHIRRVHPAVLDESVDELVKARKSSTYLRILDLAEKIPPSSNARSNIKCAKSYGQSSQDTSLASEDGEGRTGQDVGSIGRCECPLCHKQFSGVRYTREHIVDIHSVQLTGKQHMVKCPSTLCRLRFPRFHQVNSHIRKTHVSSRKLLRIVQATRKSKRYLDIVDMAYGTAEKKRTGAAPQPAGVAVTSPAKPRPESCLKDANVASQGTHISTTVKAENDRIASNVMAPKTEDAPASDVETSECGSDDELEKVLKKSGCCCPVCKKQYSKVLNNTSHIVSEHSEQLTGRQFVIKCSLCDYTNSRFISVSTHIYAQHASHPNRSAAFSRLEAVPKSDAFLTVLKRAYKIPPS